jgi:hypothetical protein
MVMTHKERYTCKIYIISIHVGAKAGKVDYELHLFLDCPSYAHLRQDFFEKIKSILGEVNQKVFNKRQILLYQLCMISKHDFHMEYYSTCPSQFQ